MPEIEILPTEQPAVVITTGSGSNELQLEVSTPSIVQWQSINRPSLDVEFGGSWDVDLVDRNLLEPGTNGIDDRAMLTVNQPGQTTFTLPKVARSPHLSELFVNGIKATYATEYTIDGVILTWRSSLVLEPSDEVELNYES